MRGDDILADWLEAGLQKPGKTGAELAKRLGLDPSQITRMYTTAEKRRRFKTTELARISEYIEEPLPAAFLPAAQSKPSGYSRSPEFKLMDRQSEGVDLIADLVRRGASPEEVAHAADALANVRVAKALASIEKREEVAGH